jgi:hypothetical protein
MVYIQSLLQGQDKRNAHVPVVAPSDRGALAALSVGVFLAESLVDAIVPVARGSGSGWYICMHIMVKNKARIHRKSAKMEPK